MYWTQSKENKLSRLEQIGESLRKTGKARALIGFGSMAELDRVDAYSDLDFLAIPKKGFKTELIENIDWLTSIQPSWILLPIYYRWVQAFLCGWDILRFWNS